LGLLRSRTDRRPAGQALGCFRRRLDLHSRKQDRLGIAPMRAGRNRQDQSILAQQSRTGLRGKPIWRLAISLADSPFPEDVDPLLLARAGAERQRHKPDRLPEIIRLDILRAPAAEQSAPVRSAIEDGFDERRPYQMPLL